MTAQASNAPGTCPECGADNSGSWEKRSCWLCGHALDGPAPTDVVATAPSLRTVTGQPHSFGLGTLMLLVTLISVVMGLTALAPGVGILLIVLLTPALVRTFGIVGRQKAKGRQIAVADKIGTLFASMGVVTVIGSASVGAFVATCFPIGLSIFQHDDPKLLYLAFIVGFGAAGIIGVVLIRKLWRTKER